MQSLSRMRAVKCNLVTTAAGLFINIIYSFASRKIFVMTLGSELVGLSSLMGNITVMLSLLDFGAGSALIYRLYAPIAKNDCRSISAYLSFYRKLCALSALLTLLSGALLLPYVANTSNDMRTGSLAFIIYLLTSCVGYFFSAERILLFADQKNYIAQLFSYVFGGIGVIVESIVLFSTKNYIFYLLFHSLICLIEEAVLCFYVRSMYPEINFFGVKDKKVGTKLLKEMLYIQPTNIAGTIARTSDNFLVVHLFGVAVNGIYSNYNMLLGYATMLSVVITGSVSATVGNIGKTESKESAEKIFRATSVLSFLPVVVCTCVLFVMSDDIVTLWLDKRCVIGGSFPMILALWFFMAGLKKSVAVFREGFGLYRKERIKPFAELAASLLLSLLLGRTMGLSGVYLGQAVSSFCLCLWYEPYILYKYGFNKSVFSYYVIIVRYFVVTALSCVCTFVLCRYLDSFTTRILVCVFVPLILSCGMLYDLLKQVFDIKSF